MGYTPEVYEYDKMIARLWGEGFSCFNSSSIVTGNGMYPVCDMCRVVCSQLVVVGKGGSYSHLLIIRGFVEGNVAGILCIRESLHIPIPFRLNMLFLVFRWYCTLCFEQVFFFHSGLAMFGSLTRGPM